MFFYSAHMYCILAPFGVNTDKGGYMNSITDLLDFEDTDITISDIQIQGLTKTLFLESKPVAHFWRL